MIHCVSVMLFTLQPIVIAIGKSRMPASEQGICDSEYDENEVK